MKAAHAYTERGMAGHRTNRGLVDRTKAWTTPRTPARQMWDYTRTAPFHAAIKAMTQFWDDPRTSLVDVAELGRLDRYFLLVFLLGRKDAVHPWLYERCREVQADRDGHIDLWARYHYKSTIITFAGVVQEILEDPEITIAIFSFRQPIASKFTQIIKETIDQGVVLRKAYPEIFWENPRREAPEWNNQALTVRRAAIRREPTVSAWGLVDGQPTSLHFALRIYDDVITQAHVTNPDQIAKATDAVEMSWNLGTHLDTDREQYIGTRYAYGDTYQILEDRGAGKVRKYPATNTGTLDGRPVFMSQEKWRDLVSRSTLKTIASQQLLDPTQGSDVTFAADWIRYYEIRPLTLNVYIMVDPARTKKRSSDRTAIAVVGLDAHNNKYIIDGMCHRMNLSERWRWIKHLRLKWMDQPGIQMVKVGYEIYGAHADMDHFQEQMDRDARRGEKYSTFPIAELKWQRDAPDSYIDRVQRLEPDFRNWNLFFPYDEIITKEEFEERKLKAGDVHGRHKGGYLAKTKRQIEAEKGGSKHLVARPIIYRDEEGQAYNLVEWTLAHEYFYFPNVHVDWLDALSRMHDMDMSPPIRRLPSELNPPPEPDR